jgi:hypothetical protein
LRVLGPVFDPISLVSFTEVSPPGDTIAAWKLDRLTRSTPRSAERHPPDTTETIRKASDLRR